MVEIIIIIILNEKSHFHDELFGIIFKKITFVTN